MSQDPAPPRRSSGAVMIELDDAQPAEETPATASPVPEGEVAPSAPAMARLAATAARPASPLARWFWGLAGALLGVMVLAGLWSAIEGLVARSPLLGFLALVLAVAFALVCLVIALREIAAFSALRRIDAVQAAARTAVAEGDLAAARKITTDLSAFYADRAELRWGRERIEARLPETFDADAALALAEADLLAPLDAAALTEVEAATRQVATLTALVPLAFADVFAALVSNLRMIRRVSEIYGGRSGTLGTWRLTRAVLSHLVATGAVAVGDDLIGSVGGGHLVAKLSRRFGEGIVNGALTARVGVAAIEVCRPLEFSAKQRPAVSGIVKRALAGLFATQRQEG